MRCFVIDFWFVFAGFGSVCGYLLCVKLYLGFCGGCVCGLFCCFGFGLLICLFCVGGYFVVWFVVSTCCGLF